ncbi:hypothetical protein SFRURICE_005510 [Spodoptera frugiperda]|nr:hypothetical protein SFRURICE_005510 [Spodoptera frugiperda]
MERNGQVEFVEQLLARMCHYQHGHINAFLKPMLQRDFISMLPKKGLDHVAENILSYLDASSLCAAELVCREWRRVISEDSTVRVWDVNTGAMLNTLIHHCEAVLHLRFCNGMMVTCSKLPGPVEVISGSSDSTVRVWDVNTGAMLNTLIHHCEAVLHLRFCNGMMVTCSKYKVISGSSDSTVRVWDVNTGAMLNTLIHHCEAVLHLRFCNGMMVTCSKLPGLVEVISGSSDSTVRVWDVNTGAMLNTLIHHCEAVLHLRFCNGMMVTCSKLPGLVVIISGSSASTVRVWDVNTGAMLNTLIHHCEAVLHLRFCNGMMVTCSKDRSIAVWDMTSTTEIMLRRVLVGHRAAVNVVDFDEKYIVSASGDRTIKVWNTSSCEFVRTLNGHKRGIACLQYRDRLVVSGSSDNTIRLWDIECGQCIRVLEGHEELVRCIRFDNKRIVSGAYDGKIKVWDLPAALDVRTPHQELCLRTLVEHTGRVFRLQFDEFQIVSSSHDDTILVWDFLNYGGASPASHAPPRARSPDLDRDRDHDLYD